MQEKIDDIKIIKKYGEICIKSIEEFSSEYDFNGLNNKKIIENKEKYGINEIKQAKPKKWYNYLLESLFSPFNSILIGISFILFYTDVILPNIPNYSNIIVILVLVIASTLLEFFEEYNSNRAAEKLKEMVGTQAVVLRDNKKINIPIKEITVR